MATTFIVPLFPSAGNVRQKSRTPVALPGCCTARGDPTTCIDTAREGVQKTDGTHRPQVNPIDYEAQERSKRSLSVGRRLGLWRQYFNEMNPLKVANSCRQNRTTK
jgi:hypothetical protein